MKVVLDFEVFQFIEEDGAVHAEAYLGSADDPLIVSGTSLGELLDAMIEADIIPTNPASIHSADRKRLLKALKRMRKLIDSKIAALKDMQDAEATCSMLMERLSDAHGCMQQER